MNLMKFIKTIEGLGIDLRSLVRTLSSSSSFNEELAEGLADGSIDPDGSVSQLSNPRRASFFEILGKLSDVLAKVDLTLEDAYEMLDDAGISILDVKEAIDYLTSSPSAEAQDVADLSENIEAPVYLLRLYEQTLANWLLLGGIDVKYDLWGWN